MNIKTFSKMVKKKTVKCGSPKKVSEHPLLRGSYVINKVQTKSGKTLYYGCIHRVEGTRYPIESYNIQHVKDYYKLICLAEEETPYNGKKTYKNIWLGNVKYSIMYDTKYNIGLKWVVDKNINSYGVQLPDSDSVRYIRKKLLKGYTSFSEEELNDKKFLDNLKLNNYIKVGKFYYKPYSKIYGYVEKESVLFQFVMKAVSCENGLFYNTTKESTAICLIKKLGLKESNNVSIEEFDKY